MCHLMCQGMCDTQRLIRDPRRIPRLGFLLEVPKLLMRSDYMVLSPEQFSQAHLSHWLHHRGERGRKEGILKRQVRERKTRGDDRGVVREN